jgi:hypothetical protein
VLPGLLLDFLEVDDVVLGINAVGNGIREPLKTA